MTCSCNIESIFSRQNVNLCLSARFHVSIEKKISARGQLVKILLAHLLDAVVFRIEPVRAHAEHWVDVQFLHLLGDTGAVVGVVGAGQHVAPAGEQGAGMNKTGI